MNDAGGGRIAGGAGDLVLDNATVTGGALMIGAGETMVVDALTVDDVSGAALDNAGLVQMRNSSFLVVQGAVTNTGAVALESVLNETALYIAPGGATLSGGGVIALGDNPDNVITAELPGVATLVNVDNTLAGSGVIGRDISDTADYLTMVNEARGVIDSTGAAGLTIDAAAPGQMINAGLIETTGAGGLTLHGGLFTNTGTILAAGSGGVTLSQATVNDAGGGLFSGGGAALVLQASTVTGGAFAVAAGESLAVTGAAASDVSGASFANAGTVSLGDGSDLRVQGTVTNRGVILLAGATAATTLAIGGAGATLMGGGQVTLSDSVYGAITSAPGSAATLVNLDNTIDGAGTIGADGAANGASLTFANGASGLVQATGYNALVLNAAGASIRNSGTLAASGVGGLTIEGGTLAGTGGVLLAGAGAEVTISGATASGQALDTATGGTIALANASTVTAQGVCLDAGTLLVGAGVLTLSGATVDEGTTGSIAVLPGASLVLASATIAGGALTTSGRARVLATGAANLLDGRAATVTNAATLTVSGGSSLEVEGAITNNGKLVLAGKSGATEMIVQAPGATLAGRGVISLYDSVFSEITGVSPGAVLTNIQNTIAGSGLLGGGSLTLVNRSKGVIDAAGVHVALTINTGANTIVNAGLIEATGAAGGLIASAIANTGVLEAAGGDLTIEAAVTGAGAAVIAAGTLSFGSAFGENVGFTGATGELILAQSQAYGGQISGFSTSGGASLDLEDIAFGGATKANYAGSTSSGVLTVTDGVHTAVIALLGNYTASTFEVGSDGRGGTTVVDPKAPAALQAFAAAAAVMGASAASAAPPSAAAIGPRPILANPLG